MHKVSVLIKFQFLKSIIPGVGLALVFCLFSQGINNVLAIEIFSTVKSPISTVLIAILLGILIYSHLQGLTATYPGI